MSNNTSKDYKFLIVNQNVVIPALTDTGITVSETTSTPKDIRATSPFTTGDSIYVRVGAIGRKLNGKTATKFHTNWLTTTLTAGNNAFEISIDTAAAGLTGKPVEGFIVQFAYQDPTANQYTPIYTTPQAIKKDYGDETGTDFNKNPDTVTIVIDKRIPTKYDLGSEQTREIELYGTKDIYGYYPLKMVPLGNAGISCENTVESHDYASDGETSVIPNAGSGKSVFKFECAPKSESEVIKLKELFGNAGYINKATIASGLNTGEMTYCGLTFHGDLAHHNDGLDRYCPMVLLRATGALAWTKKLDAIDPITFEVSAQTNVFTPDFEYIVL